MGVCFSVSNSNTNTRRRIPTRRQIPIHPSQEVPRPYNLSQPLSAEAVSQPLSAEAEAEAGAPPPKVVQSDVNVHKDTVRLEIDGKKSNEYLLLSFVFDALVDGSITIWYFAKEDSQGRFVSLLSWAPVKVLFQKGLNQEFRQPSGTGVDLTFLSSNNLWTPSDRHGMFPIVISADTSQNPHAFSQRKQITQVGLLKNDTGHFSAKVIRQMLWSEGVCYELQEIYGFGESEGSTHSESGKECAICMTEPKDTALLPCRHMCICSGCANELCLLSNKCPVCRGTIKSTLKITTNNFIVPETA